MNNYLKTPGPATLSIAILAFIALHLLGGVDSAQAQWVNGANNNINNTNSGNVGIGTANPANGKLQVNKSIRIDDDSGSATGSDTLLGAPNLYLGTSQGGGSFQFNGSAGIDLWQFNNSAWGRTFTFTKTGSLGIGTSNPAALQGGLSGLSGKVFQVQNPFGIAQMNISSAGAGNVAAFGFEVGDATATKRFFQQVYDGASNSFKFRTLNEVNGAITQDNILVLKNNGNVGIGTASPDEKLVTLGNVLAGNITTHTQLYSTYDSQSPVIMELGYGTATANITPMPSLVISKNLTSTNNVIGLISFANSSIANGSEKRISGIGSWTDGATNSGTLQFFTSSAGAFSERMRVTAGGNVGIGTASPTVKLDVNGTINATGLTVNGSAVGGSQWATSGTTINYGTGNVGIGTTSPTRPLEVLAADGEAARLYRNGNGVNFGVNMRFALNNSNGSEVDYAGVHGQIATNTAGAHGGNLVITTATGGSSTEKMRITSAGNVGIGISSPTVKLDVNGTINATGLTVNGSAVAGSQWATSGTTINYGTGNVGIGTTSPSSKLHVVGDGRVTGNLTVDGNIAAKYQDVAEWVNSSQSLTAGTVVVLDHTRSNQVIASSLAYDTRVAGVISTQPGISLGEQGAGKVLVATTGRVRMKVDASSGPIHIGDLLVTSDKAGVAMKSQPINIGGVQLHRPGTLVGKALESLESGTGEMLVLLSLQ